MEACKNNKLFSSFFEGLQDIKLPTFYSNRDIKPIKRENISVSEQIREDYKKSLKEIRKVADELTNK